MTELAAMVLIVLLTLSGYAAGRLHGQIGYRLGYRFGYRQGYFDGDRASWNRRRREMQAALRGGAQHAGRATTGGLSSSASRRYDLHQPYPRRRERCRGRSGRSGGLANVGRHARADWVLVEATGPR